MGKHREKQQAIKLRKLGKTYSEILSEVHVAKSTLSLWFREIKLSRSQVHNISQKKRAAQLRGAQQRKVDRIKSTENIHVAAQQEVGAITEREHFLLGVSLYWAEGAKEKVGGRTTMIDFANSDPAMVRLFVGWLTKFAGVQKSEIVVRLHLHEIAIKRETELISWWSDALDMPVRYFSKTNIKRHKMHTVRKNTDETYRGLVSIRVRKSTNLNRRIQGYIYGIIAGLKIQP